MKPKVLEKAIRGLLAEEWPDDQLRTKLETLAEAEENFSAFTWLWGPKLYARNRVLFRPFILGRFGQILRLKKYKWEFVHWKGAVATALEPWFAEVDRRDDLVLFRRLYDWKLRALGTGFIRDRRQKAILADLSARFRAAPTRAARVGAARRNSRRGSRSRSPSRWSFIGAIRWWRDRSSCATSRRPG